MLAAVMLRDIVPLCRPNPKFRASYQIINHR